MPFAIARDRVSRSEEWDACVADRRVLMAIGPDDTGLVGARGYPVINVNSRRSGLRPG